MPPPGTPQSDIGTLQSVLLVHPREAFADDERIAMQWQALGYAGAPSLTRALDEYRQFAGLLRETGAELHFVPCDGAATLDAIYVRDAALVCERGVILSAMGKPARAAEPAALQRALDALAIPVCGVIEGTARFEGGDAVWLGPRTLAVGRGYRTNDEGIRQLATLLADSVDELVTVPLPHWRGRDDVFHLMSIVSPLDVDLALVYSPLLPVPFRETLLARGMELVEVPDEEFETLGCNVLALAPRRCLVVAGNPRTRTALERAGVEVLEFPGSEICLKGAGGPTCLTRPWMRAPCPPA